MPLSSSRLLEPIQVHIKFNLLYNFVHFFGMFLFTGTVHGLVEVMLAKNCYWAKILMMENLIL